MKESDRLMLIGALTIGTGLFLGASIRKRHDQTCVSLKYEAREFHEKFDNPGDAMKYILSKSTDTSLTSIDMGPCYR